MTRCLELQGAARGALIEELCGADPELRAEVQSLLSGAGQLPEFLAAPAALPTDPGFAGGEDWSGLRIGDFQLEQVLGRGGMGTVYQAWQGHPGRPAAVKILQAGLSPAADMQRFQFEAQVLGRLRHPAIAQLYASGTAVHPASQGMARPYLAMELVRGARSITRFAREQQLDLQARLQLFLQVAAGVQHAHAHGVLHRDLKPSNLLVDDSGSARVIDFGIARSLGDVDRTLMGEGALLGTFQYMSPQQCGGPGDVVDLQSDVYSLGLVLYELATGRRPYEVGGTTLYDAIRTIQEQAPPRPSSLAPEVRGDLEVVILKALEKHPQDRYGSVLAFAEDLQRVLAREPILARPASLLRRAVLFSQRNPLAAAASLVAVLILLVGSAAAAVLAVQESRARRGAERQARVNAEVNDFLNRDLLGAIDPYRSANPDLRVRDALDAAAGSIDRRFSESPLIEAGVRSSIGRAYQSLGLLEQAAPHLERALTLLSSELGESHAETLEAAVSLALCRLGQDEFATAEREARRVLALLPADSSLLRAHVQVILGSVAEGRGRYPAAQAAFQSALEWIEEARGDHELERLTLLSRLAHCHRMQGEPDQARQLEQLAYERSCALFGQEHPRSVASLEQLALLLQDQGRLSEALGSLEQCVEVSRRTLGAGHDSTLRMRRNLAQVLLQLGHVERAMAEIESTHDELVELLGEQHQLTLSAAVVLGQVYTRLGRFEDSEGILAEAVDGLSECLGATHPDTVEATVYLARSAAARGARSEAIDLLAAVDAGCVDAPPSERTLAALNELGQLLMEEGRASEAAPVLRRAADGMQALLGVHPGTALTLLNLGRCLVVLGRDAEALQAFESALQIGVAVWGEQHGFPRQVRAALADLLARQERSAEPGSPRAGG